MKINKPTGISMTSPYHKQLYSATEKHKASAKRDQLQISEEAKNMLEETQGIISPERKEKVDQLKAQVESGNYKVDHHKLADKLYQFWFKN